MHDIDDYPGATMTPGPLVYRYDAPLYFANARDFRKRALGAADAHAAGLHWFVLNVEANVHIDITAMDALEEVRAKLADRAWCSPSPASSTTSSARCGPTGSRSGSEPTGCSRRRLPRLGERAGRRPAPPPADAQPDPRAGTPADD